MYRRWFFFYEVEHTSWLGWAKKFPFSYQLKDCGKTALPLSLLTAVVLLLKSGVMHVVACQLCHAPQTILYLFSWSISGWQLPSPDQESHAHFKPPEVRTLQCCISFLQKNPQAAISNHATNTFPAPACSHHCCYSQNEAGLAAQIECQDSCGSPKTTQTQRGF